MRLTMDLALGVGLGIGLAAIVVAVWGAMRRPRAAGRALRARNAERAVPPLRALTGAAAIALADPRAVLAIDGEGREQVRPGDLLSRLLERTPDDRMHIVPRLVSSDPTCPLRSAVLAPLVAQDKRIGTLIAFYRST